jgi:hypothetical protein
LTDNALKFPGHWIGGSIVEVGVIECMFAGEGWVGGTGVEVFDKRCRKCRGRRLNGVECLEERYTK